MPPSWATDNGNAGEGKGKGRAGDDEADEEADGPEFDAMDVDGEDGVVAISGRQVTQNGDANEGQGSTKETQEERRERFRKLWLGKVVEAFGGDLDQIRQKDATLTQSKLGLLIDSLASGECQKLEGGVYPFV